MSERERDKKERNKVKKETLRHRKEGKKNVQCMIMHEHVTCKTKKKKNIMGKTQSNLIVLKRYNQSHNPRMHEIEL